MKNYKILIRVLGYIGTICLLFLLFLYVTKSNLVDETTHTIIFWISFILVLPPAILNVYESKKSWSNKVGWSYKNVIILGVVLAIIGFLFVVLSSIKS